MTPLYAARLEELGPGDLVELECVCGYTRIPLQPKDYHLLTSRFSLSAKRPINIMIQSISAHTAVTAKPKNVKLIKSMASPLPVLPT